MSNVKQLVIGRPGVQKEKCEKVPKKWNSLFTSLFPLKALPSSTVPLNADFKAFLLRAWYGQSEQLTHRGHVFKCHHLFLTFGGYYILSNYRVFLDFQGGKVIGLSMEFIALCVFNEVVLQIFSFCLILVSKRSWVPPESSTTNHLKHLFRARAFES